MLKPRLTELTRGTVVWRRQASGVDGEGEESVLGRTSTNITVKGLFGALMPHQAAVGLESWNMVSKTIAGCGRTSEYERGRRHGSESNHLQRPI